MEFELLLPADASRCRCAPRRWPSGARGSSTAWVPAASRLRASCRGRSGELVRDFIEITRADVDEGEDAESNESAYAELVEFVRVGVQLLFEELAVRAPRRLPPAPPCTEQSPRDPWHETSSRAAAGS